MFALHLLVRDVTESVDWYQQALNATVTRLLRLPDGTIVIADLDVGGLHIALAAPVPGSAMATPDDTSTTVAAFRLTVEASRGAPHQGRKAVPHAIIRRIAGVFSALALTVVASSRMLSRAFAKGIRIK